MSDLIQVRRGTTVEWAAANPVLAVAEPGFDTTTGAFKLGDGVTAWGSLPNASGAVFQSAFDARYVALVGGVVLTDTAQTTTSGVAADITWANEVSDPDGWYAGSTTDVIVPAGKGGRYLVTFSGSWSAAFTGGSVFARANGATIQAAVIESNGFHTLTFLATLTAGDVLVFRAFQTSGSNKDVTSRLEIAPV